MPAGARHASLIYWYDSLGVRREGVAIHTSLNLSQYKCFKPHSFSHAAPLHLLEAAERGGDLAGDLHTTAAIQLEQQVLRTGGNILVVAIFSLSQLADWRARPLSPEMLDYARGDTHYLLYCFDRLKQELVNLGDQVRGAAVVSVYAHVCMCVCVHVCARQESMPSYVPAYTRNPSCYAHVKSNNCYASIGVHVSQMSA
eukprot:1157161-Pelagomonas_calceolata.AAC.7